DPTATQKLALARFKALRSGCGQTTFSTRILGSPATTANPPIEGRDRVEPLLHPLPPPPVRPPDNVIQPTTNPHGLSPPTERREKRLVGIAGLPQKPLLRWPRGLVMHEKQEQQEELEQQEKRPQPTRYRSEMPLDQLKPSPENARRRFEDGPLRDLVDSIRAHGVTNPLTVVRRESGPDEKPTYTVIAGERRRRAAILAGLTEVPVICLFDPHLIDQAPQIA